jgi:adenylate cyclase
MNRRTPILLGLFLTTLATWSLTTSNSFIHSFIENLDNLGYDLQLKAHVLTKHPKPSDAIAIVDIDDKSLEAEGHWPWPRDKIATLVNNLQKSGAVVIAFDMFFSESEPNLVNELVGKLKNENDISSDFITTLENKSSQFDNDRILAESFAKEKTVLAIGFLSRGQRQNELPEPLFTLTPKQSGQLGLYKAGGYIVSVPVLQKAAKEGGFINIFADSDGIFRHVPMLMAYKDGVYPALSLQAVISYLGTTVEMITPKYAGVEKLEGLKVGSTIVPLDGTGQTLIPFIGTSYTFPYYSATDILHNRINKNAIQGKIIFVGTSATGLGDLKATAIQNPFPGVEVQATIANGILEDDFSYRPAWTYGATIVITIVLGIITSIAYPFFGPIVLGCLTLLLPMSLLLLNNWIWEEKGLVISLLVPVTMVFLSAILNMLYGYLFESRRRERLKEMFGQYVPAKHIDEMLLSSSDYALRGEDREMTVLFADIRGFTSISEGLTAKQLVELLNTYFTPMTEIIFKKRGTIDKYVGDLIMAFWGAPLDDHEHARHALQTALSMQKKTIELQNLFKEKNWPEIKIGIGVNSGVMSVGDMGSQYRRNYTVLGDNVNLASRVEGLTKFYGADIIVTEYSQKNQPQFVFRKLDKVRVKGKQQGIDIYELLCEIDELTPELKNELQEYHQALDDYANRKWDEAHVMMGKLHTQHPHKKIYSLYLDRINTFKQNPAPENWDGVYTHTEK